MSNFSQPRKDKQNRQAAFSQAQDSSSGEFVDNRPETRQLKSLKDDINNSERVQQHKSRQAAAQNAPQPPLVAQRQEKNGPAKNNTGLPDKLKQGMESLSGHSLNDVKVHYNSDKPDKVDAHAYAQGTDIHIAAGQEKHLPHELWHVVQQKQGRVKPTVQMKGKVNINDDDSLEREADVMGEKAMQLAGKEASPLQAKKAGASPSNQSGSQNAPVQRLRKKAKSQWQIDDKKFQNLLRAQVLLFATLNGSPVGDDGGLFMSGSGLHAEEHLIQYLQKQGVNSGSLEVYLSTSPCSSTFGTRCDGGTGCQELLENAMNEMGISVNVRSDHLYQPKQIGQMERENSYPTGFCSYSSLVTSGFDHTVSKLPKSFLSSNDSDLLGTGLEGPVMQLKNKEI